MDARFPAARRRGRTLPATLVFLVAPGTSPPAPAPPRPPSRRSRRPPPRPRPRPPRRPRRRSPPSRSRSPTTRAPRSRSRPSRRRSSRLTPAATETLFALGLGDRVVGQGRGRHHLSRPRPRPSPIVATFDGVDVEKIVGLGADLVIAGGSNFNPPEAIAQLRSLGVPVVVALRAGHGDRAHGHRAHRDRDRERPRRRRRHRGHRRRDRRGQGRDRRGLAAPRVFYELDATSGVLRPGRRTLRRRDDQGGRRRPAHRAARRTCTRSSPRRLIDFDPRSILLGDAAYGVTPEQVAARPGWGRMTRGQGRAPSGRSTTSS